MSRSSIKRFWPTVLSSSALAFSMASGLFSSSDMAHSIVTEDVSVPPASNTYKKDVLYNNASIQPSMKM